MITEARLAANRRNALKGGVKTREGKEKSRRNALKHGYRAEVVLPEDVQGEADAKFHKLVDEIRPEGTIETGLARRMALELTKLERLEREEHAALAARIREAGAAFDDEQSRRVEALVKHLSQQPARAVRGLLGSTAGCNWLLAQWAELRERHTSGTWGEAETRRAWLLMGGPSADDGAADLAASLAEEVAAIEAERDALWDELDGPLRQEAEDRALLDTSKEGQIRLRHEGQASRQLHKAIDQFSKGRQGWFAPHAGLRSSAAPNEPTAEIQTPHRVTPTEPLPPSPQGGEGGDVPNEPTAEIQPLHQVTSTEPLPPSPLRGEGRGEGCQHPEDVRPEAEPAPHAAENSTPGDARPSPRPSPRGGEGDNAPNEPTAEVKTPQELPTQPAGFENGIRREVFTTPARPEVPLYIDGIRVR